MRSNKIFLIKVLSNPEVGLEDDMLQDFCSCFDDGDENNYVIEDVDGFDYIFLKFPDYKVRKICDALNKYIEYDLSEISNDLILGNECDFIDIVRSEEFKNFFDDFRIENTQIDDVLDKIGIKGIGAIDDIDRKILVNV